MSANDLKEKVMKHLMSIDLAKLSMQDLVFFVGMVKELSSMENSPIYDSLMSNLQNCAFGNNYTPAPIEEV